MNLRDELARAIFRTGFAPDEDEALVLEKWHEWASDRESSYRKADAAIGVISERLK